MQIFEKKKYKFRQFKCQLDFFKLSIIRASKRIAAKSIEFSWLIKHDHFGLSIPERENILRNWQKR